LWTTINDGVPRIKKLHVGQRHHLEGQSKVVVKQARKQSYLKILVPRIKILVLRNWYHVTLLC